MYNYRITNANGKILGVVSLEAQDLPVLIMQGERFILTGSVDFKRNPLEQSSPMFFDFVVQPEPVETAEP